MQIRPLLLFAAVSLFLPALAAANSSQFRNTSGIITTGASTLTPTRSSLTGMGDLQGQNFAALNFSTGPLISGTLAGGAVFGGGDSIVVTGNRSIRLPKCVIFRGTFSGPTAWTATWVPTAGRNHHGAWYYALSGPISGMLSKGRNALGTITKDGQNVADGQEFTLQVNLHSGRIVIAVPEPGTAGMLGTGLCWVTGLAGGRKLFLGSPKPFEVAAVRLARKGLLSFF